MSGRPMHYFTGYLRLGMFVMHIPVVKSCNSIMYIGKLNYREMNLYALHYKKIVRKTSAQIKYPQRPHAHCYNSTAVRKKNLRCSKNRKLRSLTGILCFCYFS